MSEETFGVQCGQCSSADTYFHTCYLHHWALSFYCHGCGAFHLVGDGKCKDCDLETSAVAWKIQ